MTMFHWNWFILVIVITTIQKSLWIIIRHRSNSNSKSSFVVCFAPLQYFVCLYLVGFLTPFQCVFAFVYLYFVFLTPFKWFFAFVYLYFVVNLFNELDFHWHFTYQIKNAKINIK
jgi:hypothetical protein